MSTRTRFREARRGDDADELAVQDHPSTSVVDPRHRTHDVPNLFLVDGSSMPTGGYVNPTNTIQALSLRAANGIWDARRGWEATG
jgi:choline dehydrogenase-like flavoprotein